MFMTLMKFSFVPRTFFRFFFWDQVQDPDQDQDVTMKFIGKSYSSYTKDTYQIWCRSSKFLSKSKSFSRSGSWFYFGLQYQTYISYIEDTHQLLFKSANSFESYCVHSKSRSTDRQTDRLKFFFLFCLLRLTKHEHSSKGENLFFHSCDYNTFTYSVQYFYILRMWWESEKVTLAVDFAVSKLTKRTIWSFNRKVALAVLRAVNYLTKRRILNLKWRSPWRLFCGQQVYKMTHLKLKKKGRSRGRFCGQQVHKTTDLKIVRK